ncbi:MAG TPA: UDP-N-acetylglucosamine 2-epimerase (non-hydrolyzing), partial [Euryarchaeota archaeon]|nr:UDP-N-acetylglucosamine 2-epimerase (non-hydrolyzing) [Euryarchaeota archaeon]
LRSGDIHLPFPEELNRVVVDRISDILFAPTQRARKNLLNEGVSDKKIVVTGNTVIDALKMTLQKLKEPSEEKLRALPEDVRLILVTAHRRESWGDPLLNICEAIDEIVTRHNDVWVIFPMHKNPNVRITVQNILGKKTRVILCDPLGYPDFIWAMQRSDLILTDSGGIQEEATALGKPTLVMRDVTERPEALEYGNAFLVGTSKIRIIEMSNQILSEISKKEYEETKKELFNATTPFGSGEASRTIVLVTEEYLNNKLV